MKKSILFITAIGLCSAFVSCQKKEKTELSIKAFDQIEKANWLVGEWGNTSKEGVLTEQWSKENDSILKGKGFLVVGKDTVFSENIIIEQKGDSLFYVPTIKGQNEGKRVSFKLTSATGNELVFENPKHDFPQKIAYKKISADSLVAEVSGLKDGKESKEVFPMKKKSY